MCIITGYVNPSFDYLFQPVRRGKLDLTRVRVRTMTEGRPDLGLQYFGRKNLAKQLGFNIESGTFSGIKDPSSHFLHHSDLLLLRQEWDAVPQPEKRELLDATIFAPAGIRRVSLGYIIPYFQIDKNARPFVGFANVINLLENREYIGLVA